MFIATMYSYGRDPACVGVDGIVTCMGVFLSYQGMLYAVHIPDNGPEANAMGREAFVTFVQREEPGFRGKEAKLFGVTNNKARGTADVELAKIGKNLKVDYVVLTRLEEGLGDKNGPEAAAVVCEYFGGGKGPVLKYRQAATAGWTAGAGVGRMGHYRNASFDSIFTTANTDVSDGWILINAGNSHLKLM